MLSVCGARRLVLLVQGTAVYLNQIQLLGKGGNVTTPSSTSVGLAAKHFWSQLTNLQSLMQQLHSQVCVCVCVCVCMCVCSVCGVCVCQCVCLSVVCVHLFVVLGVYIPIHGISGNIPRLSSILWSKA